MPCASFLRRGLFLRAAPEVFGARLPERDLLVFARGVLAIGVTPPCDLRAVFMVRAIG